MGPVSNSSSTKWTVGPENLREGGREKMARVQVRGGWEEEKAEEGTGQRDDEHC
jgi:hypothetical protein